jgi:hypothetical protein
MEDSLVSGLVSRSGLACLNSEEFENMRIPIKTLLAQLLQLSQMLFCLLSGI